MPRPHSSSSTSSAALLQAQFGEDAHQHHDRHHTADDVDDEVRAVPVLVSLALSDGCHRLACVGPDGRVVVGADSLVQPLLAELAAEAVETGPAAVQEDAGVAVERRVPLAHHVVVTLATRPTDGRAVFVIRVSTTDGSGQTCLWRSVLSGLRVAGNRLVGQCVWDDERVTFGDHHSGDGWVLGECKSSYVEEEEIEEKMAGGIVGGCHAAGRVLLSNVPLAHFVPEIQMFGDGRKVLKTKKKKSI